MIVQTKFRSAIPVQLLHSLVTGNMIFMRHVTPSQTAGRILQAGVYQCGPAASLKRRVKIADRMQFIVDPALVYFFVEVLECLNRKVLMIKCSDDRFSREHSRLHRDMNSLYPLAIEHSRTLADHKYSVAVQSRHRPVTAGIYRFRT